MTIQYNQLTEADYKSKRYNTLLGFETVGGQVDLTAYTDSAGYPTIGAGFKIDSNWNAILTTMGFNMTALPETAEYTYISLIEALIPTDSKFTTSEMATLNSQLNTIMQARYDYYVSIGDNSKRNTFSFNDSAEVQTTFNTIVDAPKGYEETLSKWLGETTQYSIVPMGNERIALLSLVYNNVIGPGKSPNLLNDLKNGNRAEAWYEISYHSNGGSSASQGIANRRYQEAELFGLWGDGGPTQTELANFETFLNSTDPYSINKSTLQYMRTYENTYPPSNAGIATIDNYINGTAAVKDYFITKYGQGTIIDGNVILGTELDNMITASGTYLTEIQVKGGSIALNTDKNDLILAGTGNDTIYGGGGADVIYGEAGTDFI